MRVRTLIPLAGLIAMAVVAGLMLRGALPLAADFGQPPTRADLPRPAIDVGTAELAGRLLGVDGAPVEGATLFVVRAGRPIWTFTDHAGHFRLEGLDPGPVEVAVHAPGHQADLLTAEAGPLPVSLALTRALPDPDPLPDPTPVDLAGTVEARDVDLSGFEVALLPSAPATEPGTGVPRRTRCDATGAFTFEGLTPARYEVLLLPPWARGGTWPDLLTPLNGAPLRLVHPGPPLRLVLATGAVAGRALESDSGAPLEGALVVALPVPADTHDPRRFPPVRTDAGGAFQLGLLPPGRYRVTLTAGQQVREAQVEVAAGAVVDPGF